MAVGAGTTDAVPDAMVQSSVQSSVQNGVSREVTFEDESGDSPIALELEVSPRHPSAFVTGAVGRRLPEVETCPYCGASGWMRDRLTAACAQCGAPFTAASAPVESFPRYASPLPPVAPVASSFAIAPVPSVPPSQTEQVLDAVASIPFGIWKRVPAYAFLALLLGNGMRCRGLAFSTNVALVVLVVVGLAGVVVSLQRNP